MSAVRRKIRRSENRPDVGEKEAGDAGERRQSNREMTEDEIRDFRRWRKEKRHEIGRLRGRRASEVVG